MKRLKKRLREAFNPHPTSTYVAGKDIHDDNDYPDPRQFTVIHPRIPPSNSMPLPHNQHLGGLRGGYSSAVTLSESISELTERLREQGPLYEHDDSESTSITYTTASSSSANNPRKTSGTVSYHNNTDGRGGIRSKHKSGGEVGNDSGYHSSGSGKYSYHHHNQYQSQIPKKSSSMSISVFSGVISNGDDRDDSEMNLKNGFPAPPPPPGAGDASQVKMRNKKKDSKGTGDSPASAVSAEHSTISAYCAPSSAGVNGTNGTTRSKLKPSHQQQSSRSSWHRRLSFGGGNRRSDRPSPRLAVKSRDREILDEKGVNAKSCGSGLNINGMTSSRSDTNGFLKGSVSAGPFDNHRRMVRTFYGGSVVHENTGHQLGSDGESAEASPCTSDEVTSPEQYHVSVKMRSKPTRRWSESEIGFGKLESYQKLEKLGEGTYATVFKGRSRLTNNLVALKEIRLEQEEGAPCTAIREVSLLRDLKHINVVTLHDIIHTERTLTLVFEYVERDLKQYMDECGNILSMNNVRIFIYQLLRGLAYCHSRRVLHRDLKPQNLLITARGDLKLADFGLARAKSVPTKTYSHEVVTLWYRPPDVLLGSVDYTVQIDMWGVGCILYEMAAGRPFFPGSNTEEQLHLIFRALGTPTTQTHPNLTSTKEFLSYKFPQYRAEPLVNHAPRIDVEGLNLLSQLLQFEGKRRIPARAALRHSFFSSFPPAVYDLDDNESIFTLPGLALSRDPGYRTSYHYHQNNRQTKNRRQSMLL